MIFNSFIDSDSHGEGASTSRLYYSARVNALEFYDLRVFDDTGAELALKHLSVRDAAAIADALKDAVAEQRRVMEADGRWLHETFRRNA